jgi:phosphohistidine phosphatase
MHLYLIRHAHAVKEEENAERPLSARGQADARRVAEFLRSKDGFRVAQVWHSPLLRARETADIFVQALQFQGSVVETAGLLPEDDPDEIAERLAVFPEEASLAIVGHEPHLGELATLLVRGKRRPVGFDFKKGAVLALERTDEHHKRTGDPRWIINWFVVPGLLGPGERKTE